MTKILADRAALLDTVTFSDGAHDPDSGQMCVMEAAAYLAGEPWSDHPQCVSPVIAEFLRSWNDCLSEPSRTTLLRPLLPLVIGTRTNDADEQTRAWMATDWLVRVQAPAWLDLSPSLAPHAAALRALRPLTSSKIAVACQSVIAASKYAARDAARDAASVAAMGAARGAARDALAPTVTTLQSSACDLVRAMCAVGRPTDTEEEK